MNLKREFQKNGFVVVRNLFTPAQMKELLSEIRKAGSSVENPGAESTDRLHFFHNLYRRNTKIREFCSQPGLVKLLAPLIGPDFWIRWDHAVLKNAGGEQYPWHQDNAYSKIKDASCQLWIAVTDADETSGGLWLKKGSHRRGHLTHRKFSDAHQICDAAGEDVYVSAKAGDAILFSSMTLHRSDPNRSENERWVLIVEYMSKWHYDPTIQQPYFMVADGGKPKPEFVRHFAGSLSPWNRLKYHRYIPAVQKIRHAGKISLEAILGRH